MRRNRSTSLTVGLVTGCVALLSPVASSAAVAPAAKAKPAQPAPIVEIANLDDGSGRVRIVLTHPVAGVTRYVIRTSERSPELVKTCTPASMKNGSGSSGCYVDIPSGFYDAWTIQAKGKGKKNLSKPVAVVVDELDSSTGTTQDIKVNGSAAQAASIVKTVTVAFKKHAKSCLKDATVSAALSKLKKMTSKAARKSKNPYAAAAYSVVYAIKYMDKKAFKNPCAAVGSLLKHVAGSMQQAREAGSVRHVGAWSEWNTNGADSCAIAVYGSSAGSASIVARPPSLGGSIDEGSCLSFWGPLVS